jgi:[ribosomal protein S5]-alanine N-acetyltransferase
VSEGSEFAGQFPLETERLRIRPLEASDLDAFHGVFGNAEVMRWIPDGPSQDIEQSRARLTALIEQQQASGFSLWAVIERSSGEYVGDCGLMPLEGTGPEIELAYHLDRSRWGRGYVSEAAAECIRYGLDDLNLDEIIAVTHPDHFTSRRILEKIGMTFDGVTHNYGRRMARYVITTLGDTA